MSLKPQEIEHRNYPWDGLFSPFLYGGSKEPAVPKESSGGVGTVGRSGGCECRRAQELRPQVQEPSASHMALVLRGAFALSPPPGTGTDSVHFIGKRCWRQVRLEKQGCGRRLARERPAPSSRPAPPGARTSRARRRVQDPPPLAQEPPTVRLRTSRLHTCRSKDGAPPPRRHHWNGAVLRGKCWRSGIDKSSSSKTPVDPSPCVGKQRRRRGPLVGVLTAAG